VAHGGQALDDADAPGNLTAAQIADRIAADPAQFRGHAAALQRAAILAAEAAKARDVAALSAAGVAIDKACEACHQTYWYPDEAKLRHDPPPP
jgi:cytochrome c556